MDQSSTNDTDKRNWRERLGIGGKDLPRISGEFSKAPETVVAEVRACPGSPACGKASTHGAAHSHEGSSGTRTQAPAAGHAAGRRSPGP